MSNLCSLTKLVCVIATVTCFARVTSSQANNQQDHWNYHDIKNWKEHFSACGGTHQSPINLDPATATIMNYTKFNFVNYDKVFPEMLTNNGHTVVLRLDKDKMGGEMPYITGGGLSDRFIFAQLHFHWGSNPMAGSEHHIAHQPYSAEVHLVHFNSIYGSFNDATNYTDGLAVLAVLVELQRKDNLAFRHLEQFNDIVNPDVKKSSGLSISVPLSDLLPDSTGSFYRYNGSLTTPSCNEDVIWTVFDSTIAISQRQLNLFRKLHDEEGHEMQDNFRPIQKLHDRIVTYRIDDSNSTYLTESLSYGSNDNIAP